MLSRLFSLQPTIVTRNEWVAKPAKKEMAKMNPEATVLVISFTETAQCHTKEECSKRVREIQKKQTEIEDQPDIQYNFLVGGDGYVYEGRGWKNSPSFPTDVKELAKLNGNAVEIAFIGENDNKPSISMLKAFAGLIYKGMADKRITQDVKKLKPCMISGGRVIWIQGDEEEDKLEKMNKTQLLEEYKGLGLK